MVMIMIKMEKANSHLFLLCLVLLEMYPHFNNNAVNPFLSGHGVDG